MTLAEMYPDPVPPPPRMLCRGDRLRRPGGSVWLVARSFVPGKGVLIGLVDVRTGHNWAGSVAYIDEPLTREQVAMITEGERPENWELVPPDE